MNLVIGKRYIVDHSRKGRFTFVPTAKEGEDFITGRIVEGTATLFRGEQVGPCEEITVRKNLCKFTEVPDPQEAFTGNPDSQADVRAFLNAHPDREAEDGGRLG